MWLNLLSVLGVILLTIPQFLLLVNVYLADTNCIKIQKIPLTAKALFFISWKKNTEGKLVLDINEQNKYSPKYFLLILSIMTPQEIYIDLSRPSVWIL